MSKVSNLPPGQLLGRQETIVQSLASSQRGFVPIRTGFVQTGRSPGVTPGPLADIVRRGDERGLDAYLFVHSLISAPDSAGNWTSTGAALFWARAFGITETAELVSAKAGVSKVTKRLADLKLIARKRAGRKSTLVLLREDGSGDIYTRPQTKTDPYFKVSYDYWSKAYFDTLSLPAKALLLIVLSRPNELYLPLEQAKPWYGISADTAQRGLAELRDKSLVTTRTEWVQEARSETGWIERRFYAPAGDFAAGGATVTSLLMARGKKREASA